MNHAIVDDWINNDNSLEQENVMAIDLHSTKTEQAFMKLKSINQSAAELQSMLGIDNDRRTIYWYSTRYEPHNYI